MTTSTLQDLRSVLGDRLFGKLVGWPSDSAAKFPTASSPSEVAGRIELIGQVVWCLMGTYDDEGIRRWFGRRRSQLKGRCPADILAPGWVAASPSAIKILDLAKKLASPGAGA